MYVIRSAVAYFVLGIVSVSVLHFYIFSECDILYSALFPPCLLGSRGCIYIYLPNSFNASEPPELIRQALLGLLQFNA